MVFCMVSLCCMLGDCVLFTGWYGVCRVLFFFKQKTAYEMRISDWSSDVCSSDLRRSRRAPAARRNARRRSALPPSARSPRGIFELRDAFAADRLDDARQHRYALAAPVQLFLRAALMFRVARDRKRTRLNSSHYCASRLPTYSCKTKLYHSLLI